MLSSSRCYFVSLILEDFLDRLNIIGEVIVAKTLPSKKNQRVSSNVSDESSSSSSDRCMTEEELLYGKKKKLLTPEEKLNEDRNYLGEVLTSTLLELQSSKTYHALTDAIDDYHANKQFSKELRNRIYEDKEKVQNLQEMVADIQKDKKQYENEMEVIVYQLKDKLQKSKACLDLEVKYIFKRSATSITQAQKAWADKETVLKLQIQSLRSKLASEQRINNEIKDYVQRSQKEYEDLLAVWREKYYDDIAVKDKELEELENKKAVNSKKIHELARRVQIYETFVENDRIEKQREKEEKEKENQEYNCIVKVQAWWRGTMVRKKLGPFAEKKVEKKAKKGGKGGKGGKKGKGKK